MKRPIQISFHNLERNDEIERRVFQEAALLDEFCDRVMSCRVVVDVPHRHHLTGNAYQVRIDIRVPGEEIAINREPGEHAPFCQNIEIAIRDAFASAVRRLEEYVRRQRRDQKLHEAALQGRIGKLFPESGYGFIETPDGREIYFHANSVLRDKFDALTIGAKVTFVEELGDKGPQASAVRLHSKRHPIA